MIQHMPFPRRELPSMTRIRRKVPSERVADPRSEVRQQLLDRGLQERVKPGARIGITAGSRDMGGFVPLLAGIADAVKTAGGVPFILPTMGSHGGATPQGQTEILRRLGVTDEAVGAPVCATMDTVELGTAKNGARAHLDRIAHDSDGIIVLGRTQLHPQSAEGLASGLLKMTVIGLGKQAGAQQAHNHGLWDSVRHVPEVVIPQAKILFGVTEVENGYRDTMVLETVPGRYDAFLETDERLLKVSQKYFVRLPFDHLDLLIVDESGKNISGSGMDTNVIGTYRATGKGPHEPDIKRIVVLSLTKASLGNGLGIGLADFTTRRFLDEYDPGTTYANLLTATEPESTTREAPMPLALDSDREAIEIALYTSLASGAPRVCRIRNTGRLDEMWISEALLEEARRDSSITVEPGEMRFDAHGNLF